MLSAVLLHFPSLRQPTWPDANTSTLLNCIVSQHCLFTPSIYLHCSISLSPFALWQHLLRMCSHVLQHHLVIYPIIAGIPTLSFLRSASTFPKPPTPHMPKRHTRKSSRTEWCHVRSTVIHCTSHIRCLHHHQLSHSRLHRSRHSRHSRSKLHCASFIAISMPHPLHSLSLIFCRITSMYEQPCTLEEARSPATLRTAYIFLHSLLLLAPKLAAATTTPRNHFAPHETPPSRNPHASRSKKPHTPLIK